MTDYRLYLLGKDGKITSAEWIDAKSDDEAIVTVRAKRLGHNCEIWCHERHVADVPASND